MADFRARQRVALHNGTEEKGFDSTKPFFVNLSDGTDTLNITSGALDVNITNASIAVTATDLDIRDIDFAQDDILIYANTAKDGSGTSYVPLVDGDGHLQVDLLSGGGGTEYTEDVATPAAIVGQAVMIERDDALSTLTPVEGDWASLRSNARGALWVELDLTNDVTIADGGNSITVDGTVAATQSGTWDIGTLTSITNDVNIADGGNSITVDAVQLDVDDLNLTDDAVRVSGNSSPNAETNPIYVQVVTTGVSASEVHSFDTSAAVAKDATDNHDYTVVGTTFLLKSVIIAASGAMKVEIQTGPVASLVTRAVAFTSGAKPTEQITFDPPIEVPATSTGTVRVIRRNDDNQAMDVYSTIVGNDV